MLHSSLTGNPPEAPPGVTGQAEASVDKSAAGTSSRAAGSMAGPQGEPPAAAFPAAHVCAVARGAAQCKATVRHTTTCM